MFGSVVSISIFARIGQIAAESNTEPYQVRELGTKAVLPTQLGTKVTELGTNLWCPVERNTAAGITHDMEWASCDASTSSHTNPTAALVAVVQGKKASPRARHQPAITRALLLGLHDAAAHLALVWALASPAPVSCACASIVAHRAQGRKPFAGQMAIHAYARWA